MVGTTHDPAAGGRPRLIFSMAGHALLPAGETTVAQGEFDLVADVTTIGSAPGSDLLLTGLAAQHAEIVHDEFDEYVFVQRSDADTSTIDGERMGHRPLRTGDRIEMGPWVLSYFREEYADHGRPFGGRQGGEGAHQADQPPRSVVGDANEPTAADLQTLVEGPGEHRGREVNP